MVERLVAICEDLVERAVLVVCAMFHLQVSDALALKAGREPGAPDWDWRVRKMDVRGAINIYIYISASSWLSVAW